MNRVHLDSEFLIYALGAEGPERMSLYLLAESDAELQMSAVAWFEFSRGARTPEELAAAREFFSEDGIVPFSEDLSRTSAEVYRSLGSPPKRVADIAIGVTAAAFGAQLMATRARDFAGIPNLDVQGVRG